MTAPPANFKLDQLALAAGLSPRTVRYYIQRGLLPAPEFRGPDTVYGQLHLALLQAIRTLQARMWPLEQIAGAFQNCQDATAVAARLDQLVDAPAPPSLPISPANTVAEPAPSPEPWGRVQLAPGIELWLAQPQDAQQQRLQQQVLAAARAALAAANRQEDLP